MTRRPLQAAGAAVALLLAPLAAAAQGAADPLRFCVEDHSLPMSMAHPDRGIDVELARAVAHRLDRAAELVWHPPGGPLDRALLEGECDVVPGAVVDRGSIARSGAAPGLTLSVPYAAAGYLLVRATDAPPVARLEDLGEQRIGVEMESVAIYTLKQRGHRVHALDDYSAVIRAVAEGRISYGYLWGPLAAWVTRGRERVRLVETFQPVEFWDLSFAVRTKDSALRGALDRAVMDLVAAGDVAAIFAAYGVPYLPPSAAAENTMAPAGTSEGPR